MGISSAARIRRDRVVTVIFIWAIGLLTTGLFVGLSYMANWSGPLGIVLLVWAVGIGPSALWLWWVVNRHRRLRKGRRWDTDADAGPQYVAMGVIWPLVLLIIVGLYLLKDKQVD